MHRALRQQRLETAAVQGLDLELAERPGFRLLEPDPGVCGELPRGHQAAQAPRGIIKRGAHGMTAVDPGAAVPAGFNRCLAQGVAPWRRRLLGRARWRMPLAALSSGHVRYKP